MLTSHGNGVGPPPYSSLISLLSNGKASIKKLSSAIEANTDDVTKDVVEAAAKAEKAMAAPQLSPSIQSHNWIFEFGGQIFEILGLITLYWCVTQC